MPTTTLKRPAKNKVKETPVKLALVMNKNKAKKVSVKLGDRVITTREYKIFKPLDGNRNTNPMHLKRLMESMKKAYLFSPIIVNEKYEVIDGQHRLYCAKKLNLPVYYIICKGYGLREVQILNANSKNWSADDYLDGYCDLKIKDYVTYREFKKKYGFGHRETQALLEGGLVSRTMQAFYMGEFKIKDYASAVEMADKVMRIEPYFIDFKLRSFVLAMIQVLKNENFSIDEFIAKLKLQPLALQKCATSEQYKMLIEDLYNYRRKDKNKINLRF